MSSQMVPQQFRAAMWTEKNGQLQLKETHLKNVEPEEAVIKVHYCGLHSTDEMLKFDKLPGMKFPLIPGSAVVGEIVKAPQQSKHGLQQGMVVAAVPFEGGLAEYCVAHESMIVPLPKNFHQGEQAREAPVYAFDASRVWVAHERCAEQHKRMSDQERRLVKEINERMGFRGDGVLVVWGEGGFAKLALDTLKMAKVDRKVILIAPSYRWKPQDYGIKDECMLVLGHQDITQELKKHGGAEGVLCCDMPTQNLEELLDGCRFHSSMVMLSPRKDEDLQMPVANMLAKSMTLTGMPILTHSELDRVLREAEKHRLRAPVKGYRFDEQGVREAWARCESRDQFECSVVCMQGQ
ncbi:hypothetical protein JCM10450v2_006848 [Rhodotorula kratochvilovae]